MSDTPALTKPQDLRLLLSDHFAVVLRSPRMLVQYWLIALAFGGVLWLIDVVTAECDCVGLVDFPWQFALFFGLLFSGAFLVLTPLVAHRRITRMLKGKPIVMQLLESGVSTKLPTAEGVSYWPSFKRFERTDDRLFLFISRCSAFVIARRDFEEPAEFKRWADISEERFTASRNA